MRFILSALTLAATAAFLASPYLSKGFAGFRPDQFPVSQMGAPVQPAGYAFSIWGVIYLWLIVSAVYGLFRAESAAWNTARPALIASLGVGALWIPVAQVSPIWASVIIVIMLGTAVLALLRARDADRWFLQVPVGLYAGWLTAATAVSVGLLLGGYGVTGMQTAAIVALCLALGVAVAVQMRAPRNPAYAVAVIWALVGVIAANTAPLNAAVIAICVLGIAALCGLVWRLYRNG
jgi:hypothetical protein